MISENYYLRFSKALTGSLHVIDPVRIVNGKRSFSFLFLMIFVVNLSLLIVLLAYGHRKFVEQDIESVAFIAAMFLAFSRSTYYQSTLILWNKQWKLTVNTIVNERALLRHRENHWQLSLSYMRQEFLLLAVWLLSGIFFLILSNFSSFFYQSNEYQLPVKFYIIWLPLDSLMNWSLNYLFQFMMSSLATLFYYFYFPLSLILVNHSCWGVDDLSLIVKSLKSLDSSDSRNYEAVSEKLKEIVETCDIVRKYQKRVQNLMRFNFLVEFSFTSVIICMCVYAAESNLAGSVLIVLVVSVTASQLFIFCWLGSRLKAKIDDLCTDFYDVEWFEMNPKQQKDIQFIISTMQNMKGFNGIFRTLDLRTFQKVLEFSYSLFALLRSTKKDF